MLYESVFVFSGQLSPKLADDKFNEIIEQIKNGWKNSKKRKLGIENTCLQNKKKF